MVVRIKTPNAQIGENNIPTDIKNTGNNYSGKYGFPQIDKPHFFFKTIKKGDEKGTNI